MTVATEEAWIDVMPAIPLEPGLCVRSAHSEAIDVVLVGGGGRWRMAFSGWQDAADWRPGLSTANGFGYALRWYVRQVHSTAQAFFFLRGAMTWVTLMVLRHMVGTTGDADRFVLAQKCREVAP